MKKIIVVSLFSILATFSFAQMPAQQSVPFNGLIINAQNQGVKAKIKVKNSDKHTQSDRNGKFGLTDIKGTDTLIVTSEGNQLILPVAGRKSLKIMWIAEKPAIDEDQTLVDSGFGYVKRREYTSSSSGISGETMVARGYTDLQTAMLSLIPSLQFVNGGFIIRGTSSINSGNKALIIVDGVPTENLNSINIHDVKSVEVQKGANMYGLRGANGVIIIRTNSR